MGPKEVDLVSPVFQAIRVAGRSIAGVGQLAPVFFAMFLISRIASNCVNFAAETRLPMAAGWDHLLPEWFTRLHPLRRTPVNSIVFVTVVTLALGLIAVAGHGRQEAFLAIAEQLLCPR